MSEVVGVSAGEVVADVATREVVAGATDVAEVVAEAVADADDVVAGVGADVGCGVGGVGARADEGRFSVR
ncbi:hypothetical protein [Streptomyces sp. NPDC000133]|uniref:hypothetical protein n=1 Tax=Streptomyces sp. NPDC000133 TaxID=3364535 RepID=UPI0036C3D9C6